MDNQPNDLRRCPRCKKDLPAQDFIKGRWCLNCQAEYYEANKVMIHDRQRRLMAAGAEMAAAEGLCAWRDGSCRNPATDGMYCKTHYRMDVVRRSHDYIGPLRDKGFTL